MFTKALLIGALAALATAQSSVLSFTRVPSPVTAGQPQAITYATNDTASPVTITLRKGASRNLNTVATLTDSALGGQYIWTPSNSLENGNDYALEISQKGEVNYFGPFQLQGASGSSSSSSSSGSSSASSSSTTSASSSSSSGMSAMLNSTRTSSSLTMMGTGMTIPSYNGTNATMTSATLSTTRTSTATRPTNTDDLSMGGSTTGSDAPANTGAASMLGSSAIALAFGAAAAVLLG